jgi:hypothetical protein
MKESPMSEMAYFIEILSVARAKSDLDAEKKQPAIVVTIRPQPDRSWVFQNIGLTIAQAERLRDDVISLLKAPVF